MTQDRTPAPTARRALPAAARLAAALTLAAALAGCAAPPVQTMPQQQVPTAAKPGKTPKPRLEPETAARNFVAVAARMEPMIESECRARTRGINCDYQIMIDDRPGQAPNAFQTVDKSGRPLVVFNLALIGEARNPDELAFVMGHEAAHHIAHHIPRQQQTAATGALVLGTLAAINGYDTATVQAAQDIGASVGSRTYSKDYELEADRLGAIIAWDAGYDPRHGARFFARLPDPGNQILGSHPPNAARIAAVDKVVAQLQAGRRL